MIYCNLLVFLNVSLIPSSPVVVSSVVIVEAYAEILLVWSELKVDVIVTGAVVSADGIVLLVKERLV